MKDMNGKESIMGYGIVLRERFPFIKWLVNAQKTAWYPVLFAALCIISGLNNRFVYIPIVWFFCATIVFSAVFSDDNKVLTVPMLMVYYGIGQDQKNAWEMSQGNVLISFDEGAFIQLMICLAIALGAFICRMIADGSIKRAFSKRKPLTIGFIAMFVASVLNGLFSPTYDPINLAYGLVCGGVMLLFYLCSAGMLEGSDDPVPYACRAMVCTAYVALIQFAVVAYRAMEIGNFFIYDKAGNILHINRATLVLSWGFPTAIAAVFALGIPAAMYMAKNGKRCLFYYFSSLMFLAGTFIINTRSAMAVGMLALVICCILCCVRGKNKLKNRICSTVFVVMGIATLIYFGRNSLQDLTDKILDFMRLDSLSGDRGEIWNNGIRDFQNHIWLGIGFADGGFTPETTVPNFFSNMYHCILIQIPAAMGIVGIVAFSVHFFELAKLFFVKFSIDKFLIMMLPIMIIGMSLVDNFFFYPNFQILYGVFLALAGMISADSDLKKSEKDLQIA